MMGIDLTMDEYLDAYRLYYDSDRNVLIDECGFVIFNVFSVIDPNALFLFKTKKQDMSVYDKNGTPVLLFYESEEFYYE